MIWVARSTGGFSEVKYDSHKFRRIDATFLYWASKKCNVKIFRPSRSRNTTQQSSLGLASFPTLGPILVGAQFSDYFVECCITKLLSCHFRLMWFRKGSHCWRARSRSWRRSTPAPRPGTMRLTFSTSWQGNGASCDRRRGGGIMPHCAPPHSQLRIPRRVPFYYTKNHVELFHKRIKVAKIWINFPVFPSGWK